MFAHRLRWWLLFVIALLTAWPATGEPPAPGGARGSAKEPPRTDQFGDPLPKGAISRMGTVRLRHEQPVAFLAVSPDGKMLASAGQGFIESGDLTYKRCICLWDLTTGKELRRLGRRSVGGHMAFSPDGKLLASAGCEDATVHVWNVQTGEELHVLVRHHRVDDDGRSTGYAGGVAFSPDGKLLATSGTEKVIRLWDVASGDEIDHWTTPGYFDALAFSADGKRLAADGGLWDVKTGKQLPAPPGHSGYPHTVLLLKDDKTIVVGNMEDVRWLNRETGKEARLVRGVLMPPPPNGREFAVCDEKIAHIYDMTDGKEARTLALPAGRYYSGALTPDGKTLIASEWQHTRIRAWGTQKGSDLFPQEAHSAPVVFVGFSPDGKELITAGDSAVRYWDAATGKELRQLEGHQERISNAAMTADGKILASGSTDGTARLWDLGARKELRKFTVERAGDQSVALSADGRKLAWSWFAGGIVRQWDVPTGKELSSFATGSSTYALAFDPGGHTLVRLGGSTLEQWECATTRRVGVYEGTPKKGGGWPASAVALSPDGRMMAAGHSDGKREPWTVGLWETASRRIIARLRGHDGPVGVTAFSADSKLLASGGWDKTVRLWDIASGRELACFEGHRGRILSLAFSPDARKLASGSTDGSALVWDIATYSAIHAAPEKPPEPREVSDLWDDLRAEDAVKAFRAIQKMAVVPKQAVPLLREKLPMGLGDREIPRLIADLDSDKFDVREKASAELERLGKAAEGPLREALAGQPSAELRDRAGRLLQKLRFSEDSQLSGEQLRETRGVQVLEMIATAEAREVLRALAEMGPKGRLHDEATAALARLSAAQPK
jgi:WD40 repeat protein